MRFLLWAIVLLGAFYSFGHAFVLFKDKNKLGACGIIVVGLSILICSFFIHLK